MALLPQLCSAPLVKSSIICHSRGTFKLPCFLDSELFAGSSGNKLWSRSGRVCRNGLTSLVRRQSSPVLENLNGKTEFMRSRDEMYCETRPELVSSVLSDISIIREIADSLEESGAVKLSKGVDRLPAKDMVKALEALFLQDFNELEATADPSPVPSFKIEKGLFLEAESEISSSGATKSIQSKSNASGTTKALKLAKSVGKAKRKSSEALGVKENQDLPSLNSTQQAESTRVPAIAMPGLKRKKNTDAFSFVRSLEPVSGKRHVRLNLDSRIKLRIGHKTSSLKLRRKWQGVILPDCASELSEEDLEHLVKEYSEVNATVRIEFGDLKDQLTAREEKQMGYLVQAGMHLEKLASKLEKSHGRKVLASELAREAGMSTSLLNKQMLLFNSAKKKLVVHNLKYAVKLAPQFKDKHSNLCLTELLNLSVAGMEKAAEKWDPSRNIKFCTYASLWIRSFVIRGTSENGFFMKSSIHASAQRMSIKKAMENLYLELGRKPTLEEVSVRTKINPKQCVAVARAFNRSKSLNVPADRMNTAMKIDYVVSNDLNGLPREMDSELSMAVNEVLASLRPQENVTISLRYGLDGKGPRTLEAVASVLKCSREMARRYELSALQKIRLKERRTHLWEQVGQPGALEGV